MPKQGNTNHKRLARALRDHLDIGYTHALYLVREADDTDPLPAQYWKEPGLSAALELLTAMYEQRSTKKPITRHSAPPPGAGPLTQAQDNRLTIDSVLEPVFVAPAID